MGCHALLQGDLLDRGIEPTSLMSPALASGFFTTSAIWASYYMGTSQIGLGSTCMTLFNFNYLFEDTLLRQSLRGLELQHRSWGLELLHRNWGLGLQLNP